MHPFIGATAVAGVLVVTAFAEASASTRVFDPSTSACNTINCSSESISGTVGGFGTGATANTLPWTLQVFAIPSRCLRLEVTAQGADLEMVLVAPNGTVLRDDDGAGSLRPLIKFNPTPNRGWYTLQVARFNGDATGSDFTLRYGLYTLNNPNCAAPTRPQISRQLRTLEKEAGVDPFGFTEELEPDAESEPPSID